MFDSVPEQSFRDAAVAASGLADCAIDYAGVWSDLVEGRSIVVDEFFAQERSFLAIRRGISQRWTAITVRNLGILEQVLLGTDQKVVAQDRRLASSTVASALKQALERLGLRCIPSRVPLLLVMLVHSAKMGAQPEKGRSTEFEYKGCPYLLVSAPIPDAELARVLSPAVRDVVRMRVEGRSHAEIAARRRTSPRTVANQLAAAFQRLGISGRSDLMGLLFRH